MIVTGVQDVYYSVANMDLSVSFYTSVLSMEVVESNDHWTSLDFGGVRIGLHWTGGAEVPHLPRDSHGAHCGATLTLKTNDAANAMAVLKMNGIRILGTSENPWGKIVVFEDPDGNVLKLMETP